MSADSLKIDVKSRYEQLLDVWVAMGGKRADRTGPSWTWKLDPSYEWLVEHLLNSPNVERVTGERTTGVDSYLRGL